MDIKFKVTGVRDVLAKLRYIAEKIPENGRKKMHANADRIVREAQLNTPVDTHDLENAIHKVTTYDSGRHGRLSIEINFKGDPVIEQYGNFVHEAYETMKPGEGTITKREANPDRYVGEKFLERAENDNREKLPQSLLETIMSIIPKRSL